MATLAYPFEVRDSANTSTDNRKTGLAPAVSNGKTIAAIPATVLSTTVTIVEIVGGHYAAFYDAETNLDASFPIDCGVSLSNPNDRYITLDLLRDSGRIIAGFDSVGRVTPIPAESEILRTGTAQAGASSTITLDAGASSSDGSYVGHTLMILSGTGANGARQIVGYNGTSKIAVLNRAWSTAPDATSVYVIRRQIIPLVDAATDAVLSATAPTPAAIRAEMDANSTKLALIGGPVLSVTNPVTAGTVSDKTGYSLTAAYDPAKQGLTLGSGTVKASPAPTTAGFTATMTGLGVSAVLTGQPLLFQSGALAGQEKTILLDEVTGADHKLTFAVAFPVAPATGDTIVVG